MSVSVVVCPVLSDEKASFRAFALCLAFGSGSGREANSIKL